MLWHIEDFKHKPYYKWRRNTLKISNINLTINGDLLSNVMSEVLHWLEIRSIYDI